MRHLLKTIAITAFCTTIATLPACEIGEVNVTTSENGEETSASDEDESGPGPGATSTSSGSAETADTTGEVQCDVNIDGELQTDGDHVFSPCYQVDGFHCWSCALWCESLLGIGVGPCEAVIVTNACGDPVSGGVTLDLCDDHIDGSVIGSASFRCSCGA